MNLEVGDLAGLLRLALADFAGKVHTGIPGAVVSYDPGTKKVSVQPLVQKRIWKEGEKVAQPLPVINNVPVQFLGTSRWQISGDLQKDDTGLLLFSEASLDQWLQGSGGQVDPKDDRRFDLNDGIFVPGLFPFGAPGIQGVSAGLLLQYGTAAQVLMKSDGSVKITGSPVTLTGGVLKTAGNVTPTGQGPYCGIPYCMFSGAPQTGPEVDGT